MSAPEGAGFGLERVDREGVVGAGADPGDARVRAEPGSLAAGELVGLFPEGAITRTGELNHFRYGIGRIVAETPVPVIPMALRGLWGSFFSRRYGPAMSKPSLLRPFSKIGLVADRPVAPENVTPESLQVRVTELRGDLW